jgi:hypothetical protein
VRRASAGGYPVGFKYIPQVTRSRRLGPAVVEEVLVAGLRAPSAHNAQPWRLSPAGGGGYVVWYAYADKLRADPDDRDGLLAVGGFYETIRLAAAARGVDAPFEPRLRRHAEGIDLGVVSFRPLEGAPDPVAEAIGSRRCNRYKYERSPLPAGLARELEAMGHVLLPPREIAPLVQRASIMSWKDRRFVADLEQWTRFDDRAADGMTFPCLRLNRLDVLGFRIAVFLRTLPGWLARVYAQRDVELTEASGAMAVLTVESREPAALFDAGRRLTRSWTLINQLGYAWHPMSVVIDQPTVDDLRRRIGGRDPIAIYRVGYTPRVAAISGRRALDRVLLPASGH